MILRADARNIPLVDGCVQTVVTSPPYWGLRDYGTARWEGGEEGCDHLKKGKPTWGEGSTGSSTLSGRPNNDNHERESFIGGYCNKCGARRVDQQIGLEPMPEAYVETMVQVLREVRRVLRGDGTVWLNLGDSYYGSWQNYGGGEGGAGKQRPIVKGSSAQNPVWEGLEGWRPPGTQKHPVLKPKDLIGIPWRVAFALQADGWYLRSDIIWAKPNPMPESVTDRPTRSHEYLFLLSKNERYFYDQDAIREPRLEAGLKRIATGWNGDKKRGWPGAAHNNFDRFMGKSAEEIEELKGANKRDVWTVNSEPTPEAHFATFPQKLIEPCILAGSRPGDLVFDPFIGSGTTGKVAERLGRKWVGLELSPSYIEIAKNRTRQMGLGI